MNRLLLVAVACFCMAFNLQNKKTDIACKDGKVLVNNQPYCLYEEPRKGSKSFNISTTDGEVVIIADVKVEDKNNRVNNYFNVKFIPSGQELNIKYSKKFPRLFIESLVNEAVFQNGIWDEYGAIQLFSKWSLDEDAIVDPKISTMVYKDDLARLTANVRIDTSHQVWVNDSLVYRYDVRNNWMRGYQYKTGPDGAYYHIYDMDSTLQAIIAIADHRSQMNKNIEMILMPEQQLYYFTNIPKAKEQTIINTAVKMLLIKRRTGN